MTPLNRPLLLGHRGARSLKAIPENTFASFDRALADGCDGFEFDVRLAADGTAVICHDPETEGVEIAHASAHQLPRLPKLEDVMARYQDRAFLDIELKVSGLEKATAALLRNRPDASELVVSSFLPEVLKTIHAEAPAIVLGVICENRSELLRWEQLPVHYVIPHRKLLDPDLLGELKAARKKVLVWTVNDSRDMRRFADLGVDGVISDDTALLCRTLRV